jgi:hypothetical protein
MGLFEIFVEGDNPHPTGSLGARPPDEEETPLPGGFVDHPFRFSDDISRFLIVLLVILWPGRFVATAIADCARRYGWRVT